MTEPGPSATPREQAYPLDDRAADRLRDLGFRRPISVDGGSSITRRVGRTVRCGIYVLEFVNHEWYVGQAVDVTRRFLDHRRTHSDIVRVYVQRVPRKRLDEAERDTIDKLERYGWVLRNTAMASYPRGASMLDYVLDPDALRDWSKSGNATIQDGPRKPLDSHRPRHHHKYKMFASLPHSKQVERLLRAYARAAIPAPGSTEMDFWSVTCLPARRSDELLARVNMHWQEVFAIGVSPGVFGDYVWGTFQVAKSRLAPGFWKRLAFRLRHPLVFTWPHAYMSGGADQIRLIVIGEMRLTRLLEDPSVVSAMRSMNTRLMQKGRCNAAASHCVQLADMMLQDEQMATPQRVRRGVR